MKRAHRRATVFLFALVIVSGLADWSESAIWLSRAVMGGTLLGLTQIWIGEVAGARVPADGNVSVICDGPRSRTPSCDESTVVATLPERPAERSLARIVQQGERPGLGRGAVLSA